MSVFSHVKIPNLSSLYVVDNRLPETADYTPLRASKRRIWTQKEKQVLHMLGHGYQDPPYQLWQVFNAFFSDEYRHQARPRRCAWEAMRNQIKRSTRSDIWWTKAEELALRSTLLRVARSLNIRLRQNAMESSVRPHSARVKKLSSPASSTPEASEADWTADEHGTPDKTNQKTRHRAVAPTPSKKQYGLLTPPNSQKKIWRSQKNAKAKAARPPVAFRAFDSHSQGLNSHDGFVAGKFLRTAIPPVTLDASVYLAELECHLARNHRGVTSFVSVSQNVLRVLRHTVRSRSAEPSEVNNWQVALIDLSKVTGSVRAVWETDMDVDLDGIVSADYQREFRKNVRRAFGEWIVWGGIPASAVLKVVRMADLLAVMGQHAETFFMDTMLSTKNTRQARIAIGPWVNRRLTYDDGLAIGRLLLFFGIPGRYVDHATQNLLSDWRYPEHQEGAWQSCQIFIQGCKDAYCRVPSDFHIVPFRMKGDIGLQLNDNMQHFTPLNKSAQRSQLLDPVSPATAEHHNSAELGTTFARFLDEMEDAAFRDWDPSVKIAPISGYSVEPTNDEPGNGYLRLKEESY